MDIELNSQLKSWRHLVTKAFIRAYTHHAFCVALQIETCLVIRCANGKHFIPNSLLCQENIIQKKHNAMFNHNIPADLIMLVPGTQPLLFQSHTSPTLCFQIWHIILTSLALRLQRDLAFPTAQRMASVVRRTLLP